VTEWTLADAYELLAVAQSFDRRTVGDFDAEGWRRAMHGLDLDDCKQAIVEHFTLSTDWLMPAHVRHGVMRIRRDRLERTRNFEPPDADPDDPIAYQRALQAGIRRTADGTKQRDMSAIEGTFRDVPEASPLAIEAAKAATPPSSLGSLKRGMTRVKAFDDERMAQAPGRARRTPARADTGRGDDVTQGSPKKSIMNGRDPRLNSFPRVLAAGSATLPGVTATALCPVPKRDDEVCGNTIRSNAYVCTPCNALLEKTLAEIPSLGEDLETTRLRQSRTGGRSIGGGHSSDVPLPWLETASVAEDTLRSTLVAWARVVVEERGVGWPRNTLAGISGFLLKHVDWLVHHPDAHEAVDELSFAARQARSVVDRAPDRWYAGRCEHVDLDAQVEAIVTSGPEPPKCPEELYVREGSSTVSCRTCGTEHDVAQRRAKLARVVKDRLATASELTSAVSNLARPISLNTIKSWVRRRRLVEKAQSPDGVALYRVGDVLDLLAGDISRKTTERDTQSHGAA
jgi:hypothetical protein